MAPRYCIPLVSKAIPCHQLLPLGQGPGPLYFATSGKAKGPTVTFSDFTLIAYSETLRSSLDLLPHEHQYQTKTLIV